MPPFGEMLQRALGLQPAIFAQIADAPNGIMLALSVVALAGLSEALAQSLVLFINHISPRRFGLALMLSVGTHIAGYFFWTASIWVVGSYLFDSIASYTTVGRAVGLAYAPQLLGFFILTPYLGSLFALILAVWSLLATVIAVQAALDLPMWQAVICSGVGWLLLIVWRRTLGRPLLAFERWLQRRTAGVPLRWTLRDLQKLRLPSRLRRHRLPNNPILSPRNEKSSHD